MKISKKLFAIAFLIVCANKIYSQVSAAYSTNGCNTILQMTPDETHDKGYQLVFQDDFNGTSLNTNDWQTYYPWGRSLPNNWNQSGTGFERQYYTDDNAIVIAGYLQLKTYIDPANRNVYDYPGAWENPNNIYFKYTSGMIYSKAAYKAGRFEIRGIIPLIDGLWPAFWLYGACAQEIDGFEFANHSQTSSLTNDSHEIIMSWHKNDICGDNSTNCSTGTTYTTSTDLYSAPHIYAIDWDETKIIWTIDGNIFRQVYKYWDFWGNWPLTSPNSINLARTTPYLMQSANKYPAIEFTTFPTEDNEMHIIINTAVAYDRGVYPKTFSIDYVKVWAKSDCYTNRTICTEDIEIAPNGVIASKTIATNPLCSTIISAGSQPIEMKAIDEIKFEPGFSSELNSNLYAHISNCENYDIKNKNTNVSAPIKQNPYNNSYVARSSTENSKNDIQPLPDENNYLDLNIYPNPTTGEFYLSQILNEKLITSVEILNILGENILFDQSKNNALIAINLKTAPKGMYIVRVYCDGNIYMKKIIYN